MTALRIVVMGVSGCGKRTTMGRERGVGGKEWGSRAGKEAEST